MDITAVASAQSTKVSSAVSQLTGNFDTFLTLLTTQLKNQDPLNPLDTDKFTSQLVQFAGVEQSIQTNSNLETLIGLQSSADRASALSLIGRDVFIGSDSARKDGLGADWNYSLADRAATTSLSIVDQNGATVAKLAGATAAGDHDLHWDGKLANGAPAPAGVYRLVVAAKDATGASLSSTTEARAKISGVTFDAAGPLLETGIGPVGISAVKRVVGDA